MSPGLVTTSPHPQPFNDLISLQLPWQIPGLTPEQQWEALGTVNTWLRVPSTLGCLQPPGELLLPLGTWGHPQHLPKLECGPW